MGVEYYLESVINDSIHTILQHFFRQHGVRLIADFENIFLIYATKAVARRLKVVWSLSRVSLGCKYNSFQALFGVRNLKI